MDINHPYVTEKLREEEKERLRDVDRNYWRRAEPMTGERKQWRWGGRKSERRR